MYVKGTLVMMNAAFSMKEESTVIVILLLHFPLAIFTRPQATDDSMSGVQRGVSLEF